MTALRHSCPGPKRPGLFFGRFVAQGQLDKNLVERIIRHLEGFAKDLRAAQG